MNRITKALTATALAAAIAVSTLGASAATFRITDAQLNSGITGVKIEQAERYENVGIVTYDQVWKKLMVNGKFVVPLKNMQGTLIEGKRLLYIEPASTKTNVLQVEASNLIDNLDDIVITNNGKDLSDMGYPLELRYDYGKKLFYIMVSSKQVYNGATVKNTKTTYNGDNNTINIETTIVVDNVVATPSSIKIGGQTATVKYTYVTYTDSDYAGDYLDWLGGWGDGQTEIRVTASVNAKTWYNSYNKNGAPITLDGTTLGYAKIKHTISSPISFFVTNFDSLRIFGKGSSCCGGSFESLNDNEFCYVKKEGNTLKLWRSKGDCCDRGLAEFNNSLYYCGFYDDIDYIKMYDENNKCWYNWNVSASFYTRDYIYKTVHNMAIRTGAHEH